jgi:putative tryptophan/tyrosine transport system substrate-binding protein
MKSVLDRRRLVLQVGLVLVSLAVFTGCGAPLGLTPSPRIPRVGFLASPTAEVASQQVTALRQGLRDLGYVEGETIHIDMRFAEGRSERAPALVAELIQFNPDVIVTGATPGSVAAKHATTTIPIVFVSVSNPVGSGLVESLRRPGGNATGLGNSDTILNSKRMELLKEAVPGLSRIAILRDQTNATDGGAPAGESTVVTTGRSLGVRLSLVPVYGPDDLDGAFEAMRSRGVDAFIDVGCPMTCNYHQRVVQLAARHRIPGIYAFRTFPDAGGLMSYGADNAAMYRRATTYVDKILKGTKPADLPVEEPTTFDFIINLKAAQELGLTIPASILQQTTAIIQ